MKANPERPAPRLIQQGRKGPTGSGGIASLTPLPGQRPISNPPPVNPPAKVNPNPAPKAAPTELNKELNALREATRAVQAAQAAIAATHAAQAKAVAALEARAARAQAKAQEKKPDPLAGLAVAGGLGATIKDATPRVVKFERERQAFTSSDTMGLSRKATSYVIAYAPAHTTDATLKRFEREGAHECHREGRQGRSVRKGVLNALQRGDVVLVHALADLATHDTLEDVLAVFAMKGVAVVSITEEADSRTDPGKAMIASVVKTAKSFSRAKVL